MILLLFLVKMDWFKGVSEEVSIGRGGGILIVKHPRFCETLKASSHIVFGGI